MKQKYGNKIMENKTMLTFRSKLNLWGPFLFLPLRIIFLDVIFPKAEQNNTLRQSIGTSKYIYVSLALLKWKCLHFLRYFQQLISLIGYAIGVFTMLNEVLRNCFRAKEGSTNGTCHTSDRICVSAQGYGIFKSVTEGALYG